MDLFPFPCSGPKYYEFTSNLCEKNKSAKTAMPELFYLFMFCSVNVLTLYSRRQNAIYSFCTLLRKKSRLLVVSLFVSR